jgi:hypothetical protein
LRAAPRRRTDGSYKITGTKIFISAGEHDLADNIIHLVLARIDGAPPARKGHFSLFIVPKFLPAQEARARNAVSCGRSKRKWASRQSHLRHELSTAPPAGSIGEGKRPERDVHDDERSAARRRRAGTWRCPKSPIRTPPPTPRSGSPGAPLTGAKFPDKPADPIIVHPGCAPEFADDALTEGCRALAYCVGREFDVSIKHPDEQRRAEAADFVALMTPIVKAFTTDVGFDAANTALQIYGGHGYIRDNGIEQYMRDARIARIYEGANGIQALDLVMRKMPEDYGRRLRPFFHSVADFLAAEKDNGALADFMPNFTSAFGKLQMASLALATRGAANPDEAGAGASDYLRLFALVAVGFMWMKMAKVAATKLVTAGSRAPFYEAKLKTANFYFSRILPQSGTYYRATLSGAKPIMDFPDDAF